MGINNVYITAIWLPLNTAACMDFQHLTGILYRTILKEGFNSRETDKAFVELGIYP